jgi:hypothetical protein
MREMVMQSEEKVPRMLLQGGGARRILTMGQSLAEPVVQRQAVERDLGSMMRFPSDCIIFSLQSGSCGGFLDRFSLGIGITTRSPKPTRRNTMPPPPRTKILPLCAITATPHTTTAAQILSNPLLPRVGFANAKATQPDASGMDCHPSFFKALTPEKTILPTCPPLGFSRQLRQRPALRQKSLTSSSIAGALAAFGGMVLMMLTSRSHVKCKNSRQKIFSNFKALL